MQPPLGCPALTDLLNSIIANPTFTTSAPSPTFLEFLCRIETADPKAFEGTDEDNLGASWGHYQFTAGKLTCTSVIDSWASVGSPLFACRLIAAAFNTSHVARWLCRDMHPQPWLLSDSYIAKVGELLWGCWIAAGGVSIIYHPLYLLRPNIITRSAPSERQRQSCRA